MSLVIQREYGHPYHEKVWTTNKHLENLQTFSTISNG